MPTILFFIVVVAVFIPSTLIQVQSFVVVFCCCYGKYLYCCFSSLFWTVFKVQCTLLSHQQSLIMMTQ